MNLDFIWRLSKEKLQEEAGISDAAQADLRRYMDAYGINLETFSFRVRELMFESQTHYDRLAFRDSLATSLGLDMSSDKDRDHLWTRVVVMLNPYRAYGEKWRTGQEDMPLDDLRAAASQFRLTRADFKPPIGGDLMPLLRFAIARTLVCIRLHPPKSERKRGVDLPDGSHIPKELEGLWKELRRHPHYRNSKPATLNQHAIDSVADRCRGQLWIEPSEIGQLKRAIEGIPFDPALTFWFWPFVVFKHATRCKIRSRNHNVGNPFIDLWNPQALHYAELWE